MLGDFTGARKRLQARKHRLTSIGLTDAEVTHIMDDDWEPRDGGRIKEILGMEKYLGRWIGCIQDGINAFIDTATPDEIRKEIF